MIWLSEVIKQNESELANTVFKIRSNKADSFFCFLLFVQSFNCLNLWNHLSNLGGGFTKLKPKQCPNRKCQNNKKSYFSTSDSFCLIASHICRYLILGKFFSKSNLSWQRACQFIHFFPGLIAINSTEANIWQHSVPTHFVKNYKKLFSWTTCTLHHCLKQHTQNHHLLKNHISGYHKWLNQFKNTLTLITSHHFVQLPRP